MSFLTVLPLVFVMVAGPQLLSAIFLATSDGWRRNTAAFVGGAFLSIGAVITAAFFLLDGPIRQASSRDTLHIVVLVVLLGAMAHVYLTRGESEPPKWMGKLQTATPRFSFRLGFLLLGFFPTDVLTSVAVGSHLSANGLPLWDALPFVLLTILVLALPALVVLAFGERAEATLPRVRDWMTSNAWLVNEIVLLFFVALTLNDLLG